MEGSQAQKILAELSEVVVGQRNALELVLATIISGGHVLLEDRPGVGKTVLAKALGQVLGLDVARIQGTPDLMPTDISGVHIYQPGHDEWRFRPGPVFASLVLVDELNRATPKAQSALLEAMAEGRVSVDGTTMDLPDPFVVIATQNPLGETGTYPLAAAQLDRFAVMASLGLPGRDAERSIILSAAGQSRLSELRPITSPAGLLEMRQAAKGIAVDEELIDYTLDVVEAMRSAEPTIWLSVRVTETVLAVARARALVDGRDYLAPEDIQAVTPAVVAHRLPRGISADAIDQVAKSVAVPVGGP